MEQAPMTMDVAIEYHAPDSAFAAVFLRDGAPWYLDGALVGMGITPADALTSLLGQARHLVLHGTNFLRDVPLPMEDRRWLFDRLEPDTDDDEFLAVDGPQWRRGLI